MARERAARVVNERLAGAEAAVKDGCLPLRRVVNKLSAQGPNSAALQRHDPANSSFHVRPQ
jgi:hypothetical protein